MPARYEVLHDSMTHRSMSWQIAEKPAHDRTHGEIVAICPNESTAITITDLLNLYGPIQHSPQKGNQL